MAERLRDEDLDDLQHKAGRRPEGALALLLSEVRERRATEQHLRRLLERWREAASSPGDSEHDMGYCVAMNSCADGLEDALAEAQP